MAAKNNEDDMVDPSRAEGWLNVWELDSHAEQRLFDEGKTPKPVWEPHFCVLSFLHKKLTHFRTEKAAEESQRSEEPPLKVRIDGGKDEFDRRWGYLTLESIKENVIQHSPLWESGGSMFLLSHPNQPSVAGSAEAQFYLRSRRFSVRRRWTTAASVLRDQTRYCSGMPGSFQSACLGSRLNS
ncbi:hypothetical protein CAPTEDRAFT_206549 [Capitella teleta]|uniref:Uncharacterized protein n=1 Tax=Capitella teleta TaxID=283909 RepID=R7T536_CAPTE|nr:hypothetical protein CAPTEDRAFT_206549 [Capitella teleta]|eukprot:ELT88292.1 hypothetical protein CAPTEDRAFT_206549 [Capitella teleta]